MVCGQSILNSPYNSGNDPTLGSTTSVVTIPTGTDSGSYNTNNTTYYFAPGSHTLPVQIQMGTNDWYVGELTSGTGATISGGETVQYGFTSPYASTVNNDTLEYLTLTGFTTYAAGFGYANSAPFPTGATGGMTAMYDTVENNYPGSGFDAGTNSIFEHDCMTANGDYGLNSYCQVGTCPSLSALTTGSLDVTIEDNEVSFNDACNWESAPTAYWPGTVPAACSSAAPFVGCGCAGGIHFWNVDGSIISNNYIHDNYDVGAWWDTNNNAEYVADNYFSNNFDEAVDIEISYNADIVDNNFVDNGWGAGACGQASGNPCFTAGNMSPAIYDSESGGTGTGIGQSSWPTGTAIDTFTITGNNFLNDWSGINSYEIPDRFSGSANNTSTDYGTLGVPTTNFNGFWDQSGGDVPSAPFYGNYGSTGAGCGQNKLTGATPGASPDYWQNCWWKVSQLNVNNNSFEFQASAITGSGSTGSTITCSVSLNSYCGMNGIWQQDGSSPSWGPYLTFDGGQGMWAEMNNCTTPTFSGCVSMNNAYADNTYTHTGSQNWRFLIVNVTVDTISQWQTAGWDGGSTFT